LGYFGIIWDILGSIPIALRFENIQKPLRCCWIPAPTAPASWCSSPVPPDPEGIFWRTQGMGLNDWGDNLVLFEQTT
jgi:hypothetical protein